MSEEKTYIMLLEKAKKQRDEEIQRLNNQLQQKENIIKEVREYIENYSTLRYSSMDNSNGNRLTGKLVPTDKILEILDKESESD